MILIEAKLFFFAGTVIKYSRSLSICVSQVQLSILCHYWVDLMTPFTELFVYIPLLPCCVEIMQPCVDLRPHLLLILVLLPFLLHLSNLSPQLLEDLSSHLIHQILPHYQVLLRFNRLFLSSNHWQGLLPREDRKSQKVWVVGLLEGEVLSAWIEEVLMEGFECMGF